MEEVNHRTVCTDPLLSCCMCRCLLQEAVQLKCLHNCCRQCFSKSASKISEQGVGCGSCSTGTLTGCEQPNRFIDCQVQRYMFMLGSSVCGVCRENDEHDKPALVWCAACRQSLCRDCIAAHRQYNRQHVTQSLEELRSLGDVCLQPSPAACAIHGKPLEIACRNCEEAKCISCWVSCKGKEHGMFIVGEESFDSYVGKYIASMVSAESELLRKSDILEKPELLVQDVKAARDRHLEEISVRKRRLLDAVEVVYQEIEFATRNAYDDLEAAVDTAAAAAQRIASDLSDARNYTRRLLESKDTCEILNQQKIVRERLTGLSAALDTLTERLAATMVEVKIEASLPENVENVVRAWIGMPRVCSASSLAQPLASASASSSPLRRQQINADKEARNMSGYVEDVVYVPQDIIAHVIGKKGKNIQGIVDSAGVVRVKILGDKDNSVPKVEGQEALIIVGTVESIDKAKVLLEHSVTRFKVAHFHSTEEGRRGKGGGGVRGGGAGAGAGAGEGVISQSTLKAAAVRVDCHVHGRPEQ